LIFSALEIGVFYPVLLFEIVKKAETAKNFVQNMRESVQKIARSYTILSQIR
jgi:hypothetical protein